MIDEQALLKEQDNELGMQAIEAGDIQQAITCFYNAVKKNPENFIEFRRDFSVGLEQRVNFCVDSLGVKAEELFLINIDCGHIGLGDIQHNSGEVIQNANQNETIEVIDGQTVVRNYKNGFKFITVTYKK